MVRPVIDARTVAWTAYAWRAAAVAVLPALLLAGCGPARSAAAPAPSPTSVARPSPSLPSTATIESGAEIVYGDDGFSAGRCQGRSSQLHYVVFYPSTPGPHPIVFGMQGTGFAGSAGCSAASGKEAYRGLDPAMKAWAQAGFVAVNIEYHGYSNGLFGDMTYPGPGRWGDVADATVELDIKPAMLYFLSHDPQRYGAAESSGVVVFGGSSGAHNAYMVGITGLQGHRISAVVGWSGLPDVADSGAYPESVFDRYMRTRPGTDVEYFGDPEHRLSSTGPPQYIANGLKEFISPANAERYNAHCRALAAAVCWERVLNTSAHAQGYAAYTFSGQPPEITDPRAAVGTNVQQDSIEFAQRQLPRSR
jgi:hypothetical protein